MFLDAGRVGAEAAKLARLGTGRQGKDNIDKLAPFQHPETPNYRGIRRWLSMEKTVMEKRNKN